MKRRRHQMPFGAERLPDSSVRFRLWAPAAVHVELVLEDGAAPLALAMRAENDGWFTLQTDAAKAGSRYRFRIDSGLRVPDPASRCNPQDVHGPSVVVDPEAFEWSDDAWRGRPWHEAVIYELHVGAFTQQGEFSSVEQRLDHLVAFGVTAIELMPIADFPGTRNWGYDGVLWFAPDASYGTPEDLKRLISAAHERGLMVLLDVVYNHFGPEGNYLHVYAPQFFTDRHHTPWGAAINYDGPRSRTVRDFCIHNALYWLEEFNLDGLRIDAVHAIYDDSKPDILTELAGAVRSGPGRERHVHLVLENHDNEAHYLDGSAGERAKFDAQWNDDEHHCVHVIVTGETDGYYVDYAADPHGLLQRCLAEGFAYQGEPSAFRGGARRGEPARHLPQTAFVPFLQNHDQVGNRVFGERLHQLQPPPEEAPLRAVTALLLLAPSPPLLFMGEEWHAPEPFPFFCDFEAGLAGQVREGRRREFARFARFSDAAARSAIPDPGAPETFAAAHLDWRRRSQGAHRRWLELYKRLLHIRQREVVPRLVGTGAGAATHRDGGSFGVEWLLGDRSVLHLMANLSGQRMPFNACPTGGILFATHPAVRATFRRGVQEPWSVLWLLERRV